MNGAPYSDNARVEAIQRGDEDAFDQLVSEIQRPLLTFAWRYLQNNADAEEVVLESFVRLHQARARLRPDTNLSAWLFTTLANLCHNRHRWRKRHQEVSLESPDTTTHFGQAHRDSSGTPDLSLERDEASAALRDAIERLPHEQRTVVLLHHYEHLSYREIGTIVGCSDRGVETRLYRARQQLRAELAPYFHETLSS
jgi:RNA polymerase sigma-70 factor (ECF subfamily)